MPDHSLSGRQAVRPWITQAPPLPEVCSGLPGSMRVTTGARAPRAPTPYEQAEQTLAQARAEAERILAEARLQADREHGLAREEGLEAGRREGEAELEEVRLRVGRLLESLNAAFRDFCKAQAPALAGLAADAAEQIARVELAVKPERIAVIVGDALDRVTASNELAVHLHPDDLRMVEESVEFKEYSRQMPIALRADAEIERGGCLVTSRQGEIDATLSGRIQRVRQALLAA